MILRNKRETAKAKLFIRHKSRIYMTGFARYNLVAPIPRYTLPAGWLAGWLASWLAAVSPEAAILGRTNERRALNRTITPTRSHYCSFIGESPVKLLAIGSPRRDTLSLFFRFFNVASCRQRFFNNVFLSSSCLLR